MIIARVSGADGRHSSGTEASPREPTVRTAISHLPPAAYSPVRIIHVGTERASYAPFRDSFFYDPTVNPLLKGEGGDPDHRATARESKHLWTANGPHINSRTAKTATCPGSAFKNQGLSADRLYSTSRNSLGYDVHRSLRGTSLCSTTKRFDQKVRTPECVGPGSYNLTVTPARQIHHPPHTEPPKTGIVHPSSRLTQWGGTPDARAMDSADEWKTTSEKPSPTVYSFHRARQASWIEAIEERQRRSDPEARRPPLSSSEKKRRARAAEQRLPDFVQGNRTTISTKSGATVVMVMGSQVHKQSEQEASSAIPASSLSSPSRTALSPTTSDSLDQQSIDSSLRSPQQQH